MLDQRHRLGRSGDVPRYRHAVAAEFLYSMPLKNIVSGGQTGVDRGALGAALRAGFPCGGWCPADREAEDGSIPSRYPVTSLAEAGYRERTREKVVRSDGTVMLFDGRLTHGHLTGGTRFTRLCCQTARKPLLVLDSAKMSAAGAAAAILNFVNENGIRILNIAGLRGKRLAEGLRICTRGDLASAQICGLTDWLDLPGSTGQAYLVRSTSAESDPPAVQIPSSSPPFRSAGARQLHQRTFGP